MIAFKLKKLFKLHADIKAKLAHKLIADWGSVLDIFDVAVDVSALASASHINGSNLCIKNL